MSGKKYLYENELKHGIIMNNIGNATLRYCGVRIAAKVTDVQQIIEKLNISDEHRMWLTSYFIDRMPEWRIPMREDDHPMEFPRLIALTARTLNANWDFDKGCLKTDIVNSIQKMPGLTNRVKNTLLRNGYKTLEEIGEADPKQIISMPQLAASGYNTIIDCLDANNIKHHLTKMSTYCFSREKKKINMV